MTDMGWGSDAVAAVVRDLGFEYVALVPGSSFRGLHDSFVNYLNDEDPKMLVCLHEEHTVAICHGYAKVTGKPMAAAIHSNVGLMHATMAFYDAWCDRVPILVLGATGPIDAEKRRPWIDWIHTARDQGCDDPAVHQVGRHAGLGQGGDGFGRARVPARVHRADGPDLHRARRRAARTAARQADPASREGALRAADGPGSGRRRRRAGRADPQESEESGDHHRAHVAR